MKKFLATILILVMAFGLALPALADSSARYWNSVGVIAG